MSELLESVKRLAEYQERTGAQLTLNYIALAKHLARLERVEAAARPVEEWMRELKEEAINSERYDFAALIRDRQCRLTAALSENPDVESGANSGN